MSLLQDWEGNFEDEGKMFRTLEPVELEERRLPIGTTGVIDWIDNKRSGCYAHVTLYLDPFSAIVELRKLYPANGLDVVFDIITERPKTS